MVSDADGAVTVFAPPLPDGPAMIKRVDYTQYMMYMIVGICSMHDCIHTHTHKKYNEETASGRTG